MGCPDVAAYYSAMVAPVIYPTGVAWLSLLLQKEGADISSFVSFYYDIAHVSAAL